MLGGGRFTAMMIKGMMVTTGGPGHAWRNLAAAAVSNGSNPEGKRRWRRITLAPSSAVAVAECVASADVGADWMNGRGQVATPAAGRRIWSAAGIGGGRRGGGFDGGGRSHVATSDTPHRSLKNAASSSSSSSSSRQFACARGRPPPSVLGIPRCLGREEWEGGGGQQRLMSYGHHQGGQGGRQGQKVRMTAREMLKRLREMPYKRKWGENEEWFLKISEEKAVEMVESYGRKDLTAVLQAYGKMRRQPGREMLDKLLWEVDSCMSSHDARGVSDLMYAFGRMGLMPDERFLERIEEQALAVIDGFNPQDLTNMLGAYASLGVVPGRALLLGLGERCEATLHSFKPRDVANTLWAYATLGVRPCGTAMELGEANAAARGGGEEDGGGGGGGGGGRGGGGRDGDGSNVIELMEGHVVLHVGDFNPEDLAKTARAFAVLGHSLASGTPLVTAIELRAAQLATEFYPRNVSDLLWAYGKLGLEPPFGGLVASLEANILPRLSSVKNRNLADMLWAYATLGLEPGIEMRAQLRSLIISRAHLLTRDEAEDVLWASERMGIDAKDGERVRARLGSLGSPTVIGPLVTHAG